MDDRIAVFIEQAVLVQGSKTKVLALCRKERQALYADYSDASVHTMLTRYRNALREAGLEKIYLPLMREYIPKMKANRKRQATDIYSRQGNARPIVNPDAIVELAISLLDSSSYAATGLGLALLTGRRPFEIFVTAEFSLLRDQLHMMRFRGQAKTRNASEFRKWRVIPVLADVEKVVATLARLRGLRDFSMLYPSPGQSPESALSRQFHNRVSKTLHESCTRYFARLIPECKVHDLRRIYGMIAYDWFAPPNKTANRYISEILGHSENDLGTAQSYQDFYLAVAGE